MPSRRPARPTILLTGFGPFPGVRTNATAKFVSDLARTARGRFKDCRVVAKVLPTEWHAAPERLAASLASFEPCLALHFGVASNAPGFRVETQAHNLRSATADAAGMLPASRYILKAGPARLPVTVPARKIVARLRRLGLPAVLSDNAGGYLCNCVLYHSLAYARHLAHRGQSGFVHVPETLARLSKTRGSGAGCPLSWEDAIRGGIEIIAACLEAPQRRAPRG